MSREDYLSGFYQIARDSLLVRGILKKDPRGDAEVHLMIFMAWTFPTSGSDKLIALEAKVGSAKNFVGILRPLAIDVIEIGSKETPPSSSLAHYAQKWPGQFFDLTQPTLCLDYGCDMHASFPTGRLVTAHKLNVFVPLLVITEVLRAKTANEFMMPQDAYKAFHDRLSALLLRSYTALRKGVDVL